MSDQSGALPGTLYIVATPIGHLDDLGHRAEQILQNVQAIYAEDTRHSQLLMQHYHISTPLLSLHEHNELDRIANIVERLQCGHDLAIISDAGTPLINDPGYRVVSGCHAAGLKVSPIPGASAAIAALSVSGLPTDSFVYCGFPPARQQARCTWMQQLAMETRTLVFYESRHRIEATLEDAIEQFGSTRPACIARELTKRYETVHRDSLQGLLQWLRADDNQRKGEFVLLIGCDRSASSEATDDTELRRLLSILLEELSVKKAAEVASKISGQKKNFLYKLALELMTN